MCVCVCVGGGWSGGVCVWGVCVGGGICGGVWWGVGCGGVRKVISRWGHISVQYHSYGDILSLRGQ